MANGSRKKKLTARRRTQGSRPYKSLFAIIVEGQTELQYFTMPIFRDRNVKVEVRPGKQQDPPALTRAADDLLTSLKRSGTLRAGDQAWIVLDKDDWSDAQLAEVFHWANSRPDRGVGLTIPQFEYWLLLHYEDVKGKNSQKEVLNALRCHAPNYQKAATLAFSAEEVSQAIERAAARVPDPIVSHSELDEDLGAGTAATTVHFLAEHLLVCLGNAKQG